MYIRPQLSRKRTRDRELLECEHKQELLLHDSKIQVGKKFEIVSRQLADIIDRIAATEHLSNEYKAPVLQEIEHTLFSL